MRTDLIEKWEPLLKGLEEEDDAVTESCAIFLERSASFHPGEENKKRLVVPMVRRIFEELYTKGFDVTAAEELKGINSVYLYNFQEDLDYIDSKRELKTLYMIDVEAEVCELVEKRITKILERLIVKQQLFMLLYLDEENRFCTMCKDR